MRLTQFWIIACLLFLSFAWNACLHSAEEEPSLPEVVSYNFHIRPILSDKCFKCHGPDVSKLEAGLRLDLPEHAFRELGETKGAYALVPGKPNESELFKRISSTDSSYMMPVPGCINCLRDQSCGKMDQARCKVRTALGLYQTAKGCIAASREKGMAKKRNRLFHSAKAAGNGAFSKRRSI